MDSQSVHKVWTSILLTTVKALTKYGHQDSQNVHRTRTASVFTTVKVFTKYRHPTRSQKRRCLRLRLGILVFTDDGVVLVTSLQDGGAVAVVLKGHVLV